MVRLQKFLAEAGVASRRAGEQIILAGRVAVNGQTAQELGVKVDPAHDRVTVDGKPIRASASFTWPSTSRAAWSVRAVTN
jgi:16S rRNA U516 pseudouridylate synthase RsuA-like enzyme